MQSIPREDVPIVIAGDGVEVRLRDADGISVGFVRLPAGADLRPATKGLPDDLCNCPHWGYMLKGRVRITPWTATRTSPPARRSTGPPATPPRRSRTPSTSTSRRRRNFGR
jgi:hypothetical protein